MNFLNEIFQWILFSYQSTSSGSKLGGDKGEILALGTTIMP